jgi:hypothetical protein
MKIGCRPLARAASRVLKVPRALSSKSRRGSLTEVVTATCPARWKMASCSRAAAVMACASRTSPRTTAGPGAHSRCSQARLASEPRREKLSKRVTAWPARVK